MKMIYILTILATAILATSDPTIEAIAIFFLAVRFCAFTSFSFRRSFDIHLLPQKFKSFRVELYIRAV